jgi:hypothetical protein
MFGKCKYYGGACYTKAACASINTPSSATTDEVKRLFCQNMYDDATTNYCTFSTGTVCAAPATTDCTGFSLTGITT